MTARAVVSAASDGLDNPDLDAAFPQNRLRSLERPAPDRIVEIGRGRVQAGEAGVDDRAGTIDAREEGRGEMAPAVATPRRAASKIAWRSACSIQTNRPSPSCRSSRSRTPAGNVLQAAISVPSPATRTAPTRRTRFGLSADARRAIPILAPGARR